MTRNPTDQLYRDGVPFGQLKQQGYVLTDVDWEQCIDKSDAARNGARTGVAHFHYEHTSHALLCNQILQHQRQNQHQNQISACLQQAAETVADDALTQVGTWGQYMHKIGGGKNLTPTLREYYTLLYREPDPAMKLIGALTIDAADVGVYRAFQINGDDMFNKIASRFADEQTFQKVAEPLACHVMTLSEPERRRLVQKSAQYIDLIGMCVDDLEDCLFQPFGYTTEQGRKVTGDTVKEFYDRIGLTDGIF